MSRCRALLNTRVRNEQLAVAATTPVPPNVCGNRRADRIAREENVLATAEATRYDPFKPRNPFVQVPSQFDSLTKEQSLIFPYQRGFVGALPTPVQSNLNGGSRGLGGTGGPFINQVQVCIFNSNDSMRPANAPYRTPSVFNCLDTQCAGGFCVSRGLTFSLPTIQQANINKGTQNDWSGGNKFYGNICIPVTSYGPDNF